MVYDTKITNNHDDVMCVYNHMYHDMFYIGYLCLILSNPETVGLEL